MPNCNLAALNGKDLQWMIVALDGPLSEDTGAMLCFTRLATTASTSIGVSSTPQQSRDARLTTFSFAV
jgi:hypothetical protein